MYGRCALIIWRKTLFAIEVIHLRYKNRKMYKKKLPARRDKLELVNRECPIHTVVPQILCN